jgi:hypothetical protein
MKFIIRSTEGGERIPAKQIEEKRVASRAKLLEAGLNYLEYSAILGYENGMGHETQEEVTVIESISKDVYI